MGCAQSLLRGAQRGTRSSSQRMRGEILIRRSEKPSSERGRQSTGTGCPRGDVKAWFEYPWRYSNLSWTCPFPGHLSLLWSSAAADRLPSQEQWSWACLHAEPRRWAVVHTGDSELETGLKRRETVAPQWKCVCAALLRDPETATETPGVKHSPLVLETRRGIL